MATWVMRPWLCRPTLRSLGLGGCRGSRSSHESLVDRPVPYVCTGECCPVFGDLVVLVGPHRVLSRGWSRARSSANLSGGVPKVWLWSWVLGSCPGVLWRAGNIEECVIVSLAMRKHLFLLHFSSLAL